MDMKSISQKLQDDIRAIMEAGLTPKQQNIDVHEPEKDKLTADDFKKLRAMKKTPAGKVHNCATHVEHAVLGKGTTVSEEHAEPDENGNIEWYTIQFEHSTQQVLTKDLTITMSEAHVHESTEEQVDEEEKKKIVSPFDWKNRPSELAKKPGETAGFDSKKISTGTVYSRKPVKEESHQSKTTMKHIPNPSPALRDAAKRIKPGIAGIGDRFDMLRAGGVKGGPGGVKEETQIDELSKSTLGSYLTKKTSEYMKGKTQPGSKEHAKDVQNMGKAYDKLKKEEAELDEAYQTAKSEFVARQGRLTAAAAETEKDPARLKRMSSIPGYSAAMDLAKKTTLGAKHTKEEVEQMDELSVETMKSAKEKLANKAYDAHMDDNKMAARNFAHRALKVGSKIKSKVRSSSQMTKEEVEALDENDPLAARQQYAAKHGQGQVYKPIYPGDKKGMTGAYAYDIKRAGPKKGKLPEEIEQEEYTFADYLEAARAQYIDEDAVLVANEAFKNQDITLFNYQSQSPEA